MKFLLTILSFLLLFSCSKEASLSAPEAQKQEVIKTIKKEKIEDLFGLPKSHYAAAAKIKRPMLPEAIRKGPKVRPARPPKDSTGGGGGDTSNPDNPPPPTAADTLEVVYVNFHGGVEQGTSWNYAGPIVYEPANITYEQQLQILEAVRYDYREFRVKVTDDSILYARANPYKRTQVNVTQSWQWYGQAGGVAYIGSFSWGYHTSCWVFSQLLNYSPKFISEAVSHEAGHTMGLRHQSVWVYENGQWVKKEEYRRGVIMGVGYYDDLVDWTVGKNSAGLEQDDRAIIHNTLGRQLSAFIRHISGEPYLYQQARPLMGAPDLGSGHIHLSRKELEHLAGSE